MLIEAPLVNAGRIMSTALSGISHMPNGRSTSYVYEDRKLISEVLPPGTKSEPVRQGGILDRSC